MSETNKDNTTDINKDKSTDINDNNANSTSENEASAKSKKESVFVTAAKKVSESVKKIEEKTKTDAAKAAKEKAAKTKPTKDEKKALDEKKAQEKAAKSEEKKKADKAAEEKKKAEKKAAEEKKKAEIAEKKAAEDKKKAEKKAAEEKKKAEKKATEEKKKADKSATDKKKKAAAGESENSNEQPAQNNEPNKQIETDFEQARPVKQEKKPVKKSKVPNKDVEKSKAKNSSKSTKKTSDRSDKIPTQKSEKKKSGEKWSIKSLGGYLFAKMLRGGASELHSKAEEVNQLNIFPVPDGDTGDNMSMTIESGVASLENIDTDDLAEVLRVASRGMLLGARGNSGVILSQFFAGMAKGLENVETADAKKLAHALELGVQQAYTSVMTPTEGTILTVAREAVEYAVRRVNSKSTVQTLFSDLVNEMNASLQRTPEILPVLGEAGVVDSGGAGLLYIIDGLNRVLNGEDVEDADGPILPTAKTTSTNANASFGPDSEMEFGYCTELLVQLMNKKTKENPFDLDALKVYLASYGDSIVVFQTESIVKIHVHTLRPDKIIRYMLKRGDFISVKVENMSLQHSELEAEKQSEEPVIEQPKKKYGIVAVSNGEGISSLFRELGADEIVAGGQTNNPSTNDFIDAFNRINAENIFVFPNNGNIIMAAGQAAEIYEKAKIYVIPTKSIGAGYVAMSTMTFDMSEPEELMTEAEDAIGRITAAYVSPAVRDADMNGVHVTEGDTMGIIAKEIVISGSDKMVSTYGLIDILLSDTGRYMITVFYGKDATNEERDMLAEYMNKTYPMVEAYFIDGGQEIYPFLFVAE